MQIFVLDHDPRRCAQYHCDRHVLKMIVENTQMLCSVYPPGIAPYKRIHYNYPATIWVRTSKSNFQWLLSMVCYLLDEYTIRYGKVHKCTMVIDWIIAHSIQNTIPMAGLTEFPQVMPEEYRIDGDTVTAYRAYYLAEKASFATWKTKKPDWWI